MTRLPDHVIQEVRQRVDLLQVVGRLVKLKRVGRRSVGLCPFHQEKTGSFGVHPSGRYFKCFGCGAAGDAIGFTMRVHGLEFDQAVRLLAQDLGIALRSEGNEAADSATLASSREALRKRQEEWARREEQRRADERAEREDAIAWCRRLWTEAREGRADLALAYLRGRGLDLPALPASIRCAPAMAHKESGQTMPCMIAGIQNVDGQIVGLHRTFLHRSPDGSVRKTALKPAKKMNGEAWGGAVRLSRPAATLVIGEGIETVLSVMQALRSEGSQPPDSATASAVVARGTGESLCFWAALSLGNLAGRGKGWGGRHPTRTTKDGKPVALPSARPDMDHPGILLPDWAKRVVILADQDNADPASAEQLLQCAANRFRAEGRDVRIAHPPEGCDFNDVLRGSTQAIPAARQREGAADGESRRPTFERPDGSASGRIVAEGVSA